MIRLWRFLFDCDIFDSSLCQSDQVLRLKIYLSCLHINICTTQHQHSTAPVHSDDGFLFAELAVSSNPTHEVVSTRGAGFEVKRTCHCLVALEARTLLVSLLWDPLNIVSAGPLECQ